MDHFDRSDNTQLREEIGVMMELLGPKTWCPKQSRKANAVTIFCQKNLQKGSASKAASMLD